MTKAAGEDQQRCHLSASNHLTPADSDALGTARTIRGYLTAALIIDALIDTMRSTQNAISEGTL